MRAGWRSERGRLREVNEDSFFFRDFWPKTDGVLAAVADGMGGHQGGEVASRLAVEAAARVVERELAEGMQSAPAIVDLAFREANRRILEAAGQDPGRDAMGTTLTLGLSQGNSLHIGHVGDSRVYLVRGARIFQLTQDHTVVGAMVRNGDLAEEEAKHHPQRNLLTRALGMDRQVAVDLSCHELLPGDTVLLCTDGLHGLVSPPEILRIVGARDPDRAAVDLAGWALGLGGPDDITVLILQPQERGNPTP
jgi:protein phosphatase